MLTAILYVLLGLLLMLLFTTWVYQKLRSGRFAPDATEQIQARPAKPDFQPPQAPIEMRLAVEQVGSSLASAAGLLFLAGWLFSGDEGGWLRLLAWPAGVLAVLFAAWSLWDSWNEQGTRVVADAAGLEVHERTAVKAIAWNRVARVKIVEHWAANDPNQRRGTKGVRHRDLVFLGPDHAELLKLLMPLRPAAASETFLASLPSWTGRAVEIEQPGR